MHGLDSASNVRHCLNLSLIFCGPFHSSRQFRTIVTFWEHFLRLLPRRPKPALAALYWYLTRRRVRARNRLRVASADLPFVYAAWIKANESDEELQARCRAVLEDSGWHPRFCIMLHSQGGFRGEQLARSSASIERQIYPQWTIAGPADDELGPITSATSDFIVPLRVGDELSRAALLRFVEAARAHPGAPIFFGDEDHADERGRRSRPWFKPLWNEELFLAIDYLSGCTAIATALARDVVAASAPSSVCELMLAATSSARRPPVHIPHILCHVHGHETERNDRVELVGAHVRKQGATCSPGPFDTVKVQWPLPEVPPRVSIIVATRDKVDLLRACVDGVLHRTDYSDFELLIVDNGSVERRTRAFLAEVSKDPRVRVLAFPHPFNFSAINNFAAREAAGSFLCLLNNDTEVLEPTWLAELMRYAVRPEIGAAGAKLLYEDGSIQHAGIIIGIGEAAGHAHRFLPADKPGYFRMPHVPQFVSAVTAACLVIERCKFDEVGGFDEEIAVAFNDVDFCLRIEAAGWRNVYVPHALLLHHESKSRGNDLSPENIDRFGRELEILQRRWGTNSYVDPAHNPNLDRYSETFVIGL